MYFSDIKFMSRSLGRHVSVNVLLPENEALQPYKVVYLLHGHSDDYTLWMRRTSIEWHAEKRGVAVVMPGADLSFYSNTVYGDNYYDFIAKELPERMENIFPISSKPEDKYVAGLSMGGYGALKIALRECGKFGGAIGLSSAAHVVNGISKGYCDKIYGPEGAKPEDDLLYLAEQAVKREDKPRLYIAIGTEDFLYSDNITLRKKLDDIGYEYTYREGPGEHTWDFWNEYIQYGMDWMLGR